MSAFPDVKFLQDICAPFEDYNCYIVLESLNGRLLLKRFLKSSSSSAATENLEIQACLRHSSVLKDSSSQTEKAAVELTELHVNSSNCISCQTTSPPLQNTTDAFQTSATEPFITPDQQAKKSSTVDSGVGNECASPCSESSSLVMTSPRPLWVQNSPVNQTTPLNHSETPPAQFANSGFSEPSNQLENFVASNPNTSVRVMSRSSVSSIVSSLSMSSDITSRVPLPENSEMSLRPELPMVPEGSEKMKMNNCFRIKASPLLVENHVSRCFKDFSISSAPDDNSLLSRLSRENFLSKSGAWLISQNLVANPGPCSSCDGSLVLVSVNHNNTDFHWVCDECQTSTPFGRPFIYNQFPNASISDLLAITYHWSFHSNVNEIVKDTELNLTYIASIWKAIRNLCSQIIQKNSERIGGSCRENIVEVAVVRFGEFLVVGAMERKTKFTRIKAFSLTAGCQSSGFRDEVRTWLLPHSYVISLGADFKNIQKEGLVHLDRDPEAEYEEVSPDYHVRHILYYLKSRLGQLFSSFATNSIRTATLQEYLDELQWRERYGHNGEMAFWNVLHFIFGQTYSKACPLPDSHLLNLGFPEVNGVRTAAVVCESVPNDNLTIAHQNEETNVSTVSSLEEVPAVSEPVAVNHTNTSDVQASNVEPQVEDHVEVPLVVPKNEPLDTEIPNDPHAQITPSSDNVTGLIVTTAVPKSEPVCNENEELANDENVAMLDDFGQVLPNIPCLPEGDVEVSDGELLKIKTIPFPTVLKDRCFWIANDKIEGQRAELKKKLSEERLFTCPVSWLVSTEMFRRDETCNICKETQAILHPYPSMDEWGFTCMNPKCNGKRPFARPEAFSKFGIPLRNILLLLYHWAVQTNIDDILQEISHCVIAEASSININADPTENVVMSIANMKIEEIWSFYRVLHEALSVTLVDPHYNIGGANSTVEANVIKFGIFYVLCALDRKTASFRIKAFPVTAGWDMSVIGKQLESWLEPKTTVISPFAELTFSNNTIVHCISNADSEMNVRLVTDFVSEMISSLFGHFCTALLSIEAFQGFLDEIQWRHKDATSLTASFFNMLYVLKKVNEPNNSGNTDYCISATNPGDTNASYLKSAPGTKKRNSNTANSSKSHQSSSTVNIESNIPSSLSSPSESTELNGIVLAELTSASSPLLSSSVSNAVRVANIVANAVPVTSVVHSAVPVVSRTTASRPSVIQGNPPSKRPSPPEHNRNTQDSGSQTGNDASSQPNNTYSNFAKKHRLMLDCYSGQISDYASSLQEESRRTINTAAITDELQFYARRCDMNSKTTEANLAYNNLIYRCHICGSSLSGNFNMMNHTKQHYDDQRKIFLKRSFYQCMKCFAEFESSDVWKEHMKEVHVNEHSTSCLLCSIMFPTHSELLQHMRENHVLCEMPYHCKICEFRSSLYQDMIDHFLNLHYDSSDLMCFFCLKLFVAELQPDGFHMTEKYVNHVMLHAKRDNATKCSTCSLFFVTKTEVTSHLSCDHVSFAFDKGVSNFINRKPMNSNIKKAPPPKPMINRASEFLSSFCGPRSPTIRFFPHVSLVSSLKSPQNQYKKVHFLQSKKPLKKPQKQFKKTQVQLEAPCILIDPKVFKTKSACQECRKWINQNHFRLKHKCPCGYTSNCTSAYRKHRSKCKNLKKKIPYCMLKQILVCPCGKRSKDGNAMAFHLSQSRCNYVTMYKKYEAKSVSTHSPSSSSSINFVLNDD